MKLILCILVTIASAEKFPSFITKCKISDKNVNLCIKNSMNEAIPNLSEGYEPYGIPKLNPMKIYEILVSNDPNLFLEMRNVEIRGLTNFHTETVTFSLKPVYSSNIMTNPEINISGDYVINGVILDKPIFGKGRASITLVDGIYSWYPPLYAASENNTIYYKLRSLQKYMFSNKNVKFNFENLYDGDEAKGKEMNQFLNDNWGLTIDLFRNGLNTAFAQIVTYVSEKFGDNVPVNELFAVE